jgi:hypothetical protein
MERLKENSKNETEKYKTNSTKLKETNLNIDPALHKAIVKII